MNIKVMKQFKQMDLEMLASVDGGSNNWQNNVLEGVGAVIAGWGLGTSICTATGAGAPLAPAYGYIGAKFGVALWVGVTGGF